MLRARAVTPATLPEAWCWLMPHAVAVWIYWEAVWLLAKGVAFVPHPKYDGGMRYREDAAAGEAAMAASGQRRRRGAAGCPVFQWREASAYPWTAGNAEAVQQS